MKVGQALTEEKSNSSGEKVIPAVVFELLLMLPNDWRHFFSNGNLVCGCICSQVANLNPKDNSYTLKDFVYREVQRDWPGYSEDDRVQVNGILAR